MFESGSDIGDESVGFVDIFVYFLLQIVSYDRVTTG